MLSRNSSVSRRKTIYVSLPGSGRQQPDSATPTIHSWDPLRLPSRDLMALVGSSEFKNGTRGQASREIP